MENDKVIKGFKGFDKDMKCRGFQFKEGESYETEKAVICESGFHFCKNPLHVLRYYPPVNSRYFMIEGGGKTATHTEDSKVACTKIKIGTEIKLKGLLEAGFKFVFEKIKWGNEDTPQTHGDFSAAQTHGNFSAAQTHGNFSAAQTHGNESIAVSTGYSGKAAGKVGNWLVLAEWNESGNKIKSVKTVKVDGKKIKADTFYTLKNGEFVEVE